MRKSFLILMMSGLVVFLLISGCQKKTTQAELNPGETLNPVGNEKSPTEKGKAGEDELDDFLALDKDEAIQTQLLNQDASNLNLRDINFDFDQSELNATAREILSQHARVLANFSQVKVVIEGHCDDRGTIEYNLALGDRRAEIVKKYLVNYGIAADRLSTISYGKERPLDPRTAEDAWAKNRRASFVIMQR
ncbi:peptidoglycan-associated lipoprotein Pal [candidate division KSB1 bacterium]|nr:peptidoglycan-associated lipoprotein Pal [candidate division KSB1 bacterium]